MTATPKIETKSVKHTFTLEERDEIGGELARALGRLRGVEAEFEQVKASYKSKAAEAEAQIGSLETKRMNGFEFRNERCRLAYFPKERVKRYWLEDAAEDAEPVLVEPMTQEDYQSDLLLAESKFEERQEIPIFDAGQDRGVLVIGKFSNAWFTALRVKVGKHGLDERLDSEQPCCKKRFDAITKATKRLTEWLVANLGKDAAKGFDEGIAVILESQREISD